MPKLSVHGTISRSTADVCPSPERSGRSSSSLQCRRSRCSRYRRFRGRQQPRLSRRRERRRPGLDQYLAWATDAAHHGLIANLYGFNNGDHVFFHPIWLATGLFHVDAGVSYPLLLGLWQAAAVILLVIVLRRYAQLVLGNDWTGPGDLADARAVPRQPVLPVRRQPPPQAQRPVDVAADQRELRRAVDQRPLPDCVPRSPR